MVRRGSGHGAASSEIPRSLLVPPGHYQTAPQSLGWTRVCGTENSGVWVLEGDTRTHNLPEDVDDVGLVWERVQAVRLPGPRQGTAVGRGAVQPQANPSIFTEAIHLSGRLASLP